jgi:hypothetical protein
MSIVKCEELAFASISLELDWGIQGTSIYTPTKYDWFLSTIIIQPTMFLNLNKKSDTIIHQRCYQMCYANHNEIK